MWVLKKNSFGETILLSKQMLKLMDKKRIKILRPKMLFIWTVVSVTEQAGLSLNP